MGRVFIGLETFVLDKYFTNLASFDFFKSCENPLIRSLSEPDVRRILLETLEDEGDYRNFMSSDLPSKKALGGSVMSILSNLKRLSPLDEVVVGGNLGVGEDGILDENARTYLSQAGGIKVLAKKVPGRTGTIDVLLAKDDPSKDRHFVATLGVAPKITFHSTDKLAQLISMDATQLRFYDDPAGFRVYLADDREINAHLFKKQKQDSETISFVRQQNHGGGVIRTTDKERYLITNAFAAEHNPEAVIKFLKLGKDHNHMTFFNMSDISVIRNILAKGPVFTDYGAFGGVGVGVDEKGQSSAGVKKKRDYFEDIFANSSVVIGNDDEVLGYCFGKTPSELMADKGLDLEDLSYLSDKHLMPLLTEDLGGVKGKIIGLKDKNIISAKHAARLVNCATVHEMYIDLLVKASEKINSDYVAVTCGKFGAAAYSKKNKKFVFRPARPLLSDDIGDTNGAGDAFSAGFIHVLTSGDNPALESAVDTGQYLAYMQLLAIGGNPNESELTLKRQTRFRAYIEEVSPLGKLDDIIACTVKHSLKEVPGSMCLVRKTNLETQKNDVVMSHPANSAIIDSALLDRLSEGADSFSGIVLKDGLPLVLSDLTEHSAADGLLMDNFDVTSYMGIPIFVGGEAGYVFEFFHKDPNKYGINSVDYIQNLLACRHIEAAIQKERLIHLATHDPLTGVKNRRTYLDESANEVLRSMRYGHNLSLFMIDIDHFKNINDTKGHDAGDKALVDLCRGIESQIRDIDSLYRFGGEEFLLLLPETSEDSAIVVGERILQYVESALGFTVTIGSATLNAKKGEPVTSDPNFRDAISYIEVRDCLTKHADTALYKGKEQRNVYISYTPDLNGH